MCRSCGHVPCAALLAQLHPTCARALLLNGSVGPRSQTRRAIAEWREATGSDRRIYVVTKAGRAHGDAAAPISDAPHGDQNYQEGALRAAIAASSERLGVQKLDLVLMHCPPTETLRKGELFDILGTLKAEGKMSEFTTTCWSLLPFFAKPATANGKLLRGNDGLLKKTPRLQPMDA